MNRLFSEKIIFDPQNVPGGGRVRCHMLFLVMMLLLLPVVAGDPEAAFAAGPLFQASQAVSAYPAVEVYLDVIDGQGVPLPPVATGVLKAEAEDRELPIRSVRPFFDTGQGVGYVFLVDVSRSLGEDELSGMRKAISAWVTPCGAQDRFALVTFGSEVRVLQDFTAEKDRFLASVLGLHPTDMLTSLHGALLEAQRLGSRQDPDLPARRVIIVLSDGKNETLYGETSGEVLRNLREASAPIFALGYYHPPFEGKKEYLQRLDRFARASGGAYFRPGDEGLGAVFDRIRSRIDNTWVVDIDVAAISPRGQNLSVEIGYPQGGRFLSDVFNVRLVPPALALKLEGESSSEAVGESGMPTAKADVSPIRLSSAMGQETTESGRQEPQNGAKPPKGGGEMPRNEKTGFRPFLFGGGFLAFCLLLLWGFARKAGPGNGNVPGMPVAPRKPDPDPEIPPVPGPSGLALRLEVFHGRRVARSFRLVLSGSRTLGRSEENDISIADDRTISGRHCELVLKDQQLAVRDLDSTNGTYVNNLRSEGLTPLKDGDMLRIGQTSIHFVFEGPPVSVEEKV